MYNSQYYTCEQIDERLLQGYLDDYNSQTGQSLTKAQFLTKLGSLFSKEGTIDNTLTQIGYYECDTAAGTAAKVITVASYSLFAGGSMKVKFVNKNTANNATLNINSQGAKALYYNGVRVSSTNTWDAGEVVEIYYDGTSYYANNVKGSTGDGVFDISVYNPTEGQPTKYADLASALGPNGQNVPVQYRKGGMSVKFVQSSDNNYVYFNFLLSGSFTDAQFANVANWQGVDDEPTAGSQNLVKSGGVFFDSNKIQSEIGSYDEIAELLGFTLGQLDISKNANASLKIIKVNPSDNITLSPQTNNYIEYVVVKSISEKIVTASLDVATGYETGKVSTTRITTFTVPVDGYYLIVRTKTGSGVDISPNNIRINGRDLSKSMSLNITFKGSNLSPNDVAIEEDLTPSSNNLTKSASIVKGLDALNQNVYGLNEMFHYAGRLGTDITYDDHSNSYFVVVKVKPQDIIKIKGISSLEVASFAVVKDYKGLGQLDFTDDEAFSSRIEVGVVEKTYTMPAGANYMIVVMVIIGNNRAPSVFTINGQSVLDSLYQRIWERTLGVTGNLPSLTTDNKSNLVNAINEVVQRLSSIITIDTDVIIAWLEAHPIPRDSDDAIAWYYNSSMRNPKYGVYSYINTLFNTNNIVANQLNLSEEGDVCCHDSTLILGQSNTAYIVLSANKTNNIDSPGENSQTFTRLVKVSFGIPSGRITKLSSVDFLKSGETYPIKIGGVTEQVTLGNYGSGVPNMIRINNEKAVIISQAAIGNNNYFSIICCDLNLSTGELSNYRVPNITLWNTTTSMDMYNLTQYFNSLGLDYMYSSYYNNVYFNPNCSIAYDSASGYYYMCAGKFSLWQKLPIFKTMDFETFDEPFIPNVQATVHASMEGALAIRGNYIYMAVRQQNQINPATDTRVDGARTVMNLVKFNKNATPDESRLVEVIEDLVIPDSGSRPTFIDDKGNLYLCHCTQSRDYADMLLIDDEILRNSRVVQGINALANYTSAQNFENRFLVMSGTGPSNGRAAVFASTFVTSQKTQEQIDNAYVSLFDSE